MPEDLKPCPFCAYTKTRIESYPVKNNFADIHTEYAVMCENCGAFGPNDLGKSGAIAMWNLRRKEYPPKQTVPIDDPDPPVELTEYDYGAPQDLGDQ